MKTVSILRVLASLALVAAFLATGAVAEGKSVSVTGEILDMACYLGHGAQGSQHRTCALKCLKGGQPMGLKAKDGTVYLLVASHKDGSAFEAAKQYAGDSVTVQGPLLEKDGFKAIEVDSVKK